MRIENLQMQGAMKSCSGSAAPPGHRIPIPTLDASTNDEGQSHSSEVVDITAVRGDNLTI